ncbi:unnamed protein product [Oppiella nova]|uniref:Uncharacterized protein n=1 Tax=Oppiella nova TaxID=334625 RepID=A0A7R9LNS3_9ACAR|nr:unnamed protein product [Oppiella nova]CAG2165462.1 unnamed protein product [Oppiella nova]
MTVLDVIRTIANVGNGTIIGVLFGSASYLCYDTFSKLDQPYRQANFYGFCSIVFVMATAGAIAEIYYMHNQEHWNRVRYVRHTDGSIEIVGEEDKVLDLINKEL